MLQQQHPGQDMFQTKIPMLPHSRWQLSSIFFFFLFFLIEVSRKIREIAEDTLIVHPAG